MSQELHREAQELEKAIVAMAQRLKPPSVSEQEQVRRWQTRLAEIRTRLGYVLTASGRLQPPPEKSDPSPPAKKSSSVQVADPSAVFGFAKDADSGAALRINKIQE